MLPFSNIASQKFGVLCSPHSTLPTLSHTIKKSNSAFSFKNLAMESDDQLSKQTILFKNLIQYKNSEYLMLLPFEKTLVSTETNQSKLKQIIINQEKKPRYSERDSLKKYMSMKKITTIIPKPVMEEKRNELKNQQSIVKPKQKILKHIQFDQNNQNKFSKKNQISESKKQKKNDQNEIKIKEQQIKHNLHQVVKKNKNNHTKNSPSPKSKPQLMTPDSKKQHLLNLSQSNLIHQNIRKDFQKSVHYQQPEKVKQNCHNKNEPTIHLPIPQSQQKINIKNESRIHESKQLLIIEEANEENNQEKDLHLIQPNKQIPQIKIIQKQIQKPVYMGYDDLFLSDDEFKMSHISKFKCQGSYYSLNTSYQQVVQKIQNKQEIKKLNSLASEIEQLKQLIKEEKINHEKQNEIFLMQNKDMLQEKFKILHKEINHLAQNIDHNNILEPTVVKIQQVIENTSPVINQTILAARAPIVKYLFLNQKIKQQLLSKIPKNNEEIYEDQQFLFETGNIITWLYFTQLPNCSNPPLLFSQNLNRTFSSNSYPNFGLALQFLTNMDPQLTTIKYLFEQPQNGLFCIWLYFRGKYLPVYLDGYFPFDQNMNPMYTFSNLNQIWVFALEKALAKLLNGYEFIGKLSIFQIIQFITGTLASVIQINNNKQKALKLLTASLDNGDKVFLQYKNQYREIINYSDTINKRSQKKLYLKNDSKATSFTELYSHYQKIILIRMRLEKHRYYFECIVNKNNTICKHLQLEKLQIIGIHIFNQNQNHVNLEMCIYRVENQMLYLVSQKKSQQQNELEIEAELKKGEYKIFISCQENYSEISLQIQVVGVIQKKVNNFEVLNKKSDSEIGNRELCYKILPETINNVNNIEKKSKSERQKLLRQKLANHSRSRFLTKNLKGE